MQEENVEVVRRTVEAFNEGGIEAAQAFFADEIEFHEPPEQPAPRVARGREQTVKMFGEFDEAWAEHRSELEEIRAIGPDKVLMITTEHFRGRDGVEVSSPFAGIATVRDGEIVDWRAYWDRASALAAASD
jgi:ketosteroid isomerase-like protein